MGTTLGRLVAQACGCVCVALSAVLSSVAEIRVALARAEQTANVAQRTILFVDEIHRCNQQQQQALLAAAKSARVILVGATTENPSFALKPALLSRLKVYVLKPLGDRDMLVLIDRARAREIAHIWLDDVAIATVMGLADGDARGCLNLLEQLRTAADALGVEDVDAAFIDHVLASNARRFDKGGDNFYDQISALHKSVRGQHPDAALYWLCRMVDGGADPRAVRTVRNAAEVCERLGSEEVHLALAQAAIYLAVADQSNAGASAFGAAMVFARSTGPHVVQPHLRGRFDETRTEPGSIAHRRHPHEEAGRHAVSEAYFPLMAWRNRDGTCRSLVARSRRLDRSLRRFMAPGAHASSTAAMCELT
jgi:putative ATPase